MEVEHKSSGVNYLVGRLTGVVLVFVIRIQLDVLAHWE
jgi:succinate dehydrogenase hydrophobic anchor subunit